MTHEALAARLSRQVPRLARVAFEGSLPFGPTLRVSRWRLGNGLEVLLLPDPSAPVIATHAPVRRRRTSASDASSAASSLARPISMLRIEGDPPYQ